MSDTGEEMMDSCDSDSCDEWQDYFSDDHEGKVLDDDELPPVSLNENKYKLEQCSICFEDLDQEIGTLDVCVHMFCLKCITLWSQLSKYCPEDGRKFSQIMKFVKREDKIMYQHEKGIEISCGKPDLRPQSSQPIRSPKKCKKFGNLSFWKRNENLPEPIWRFRSQELKQGIKQQNSWESSTFELPTIQGIRQNSSHISSFFPREEEIQQEKQLLRSRFFQIPMWPGEVREFHDIRNRMSLQVASHSENRETQERNPFRYNIPQSLATSEMNEDISHLLDDSEICSSSDSENCSSPDSENCSSPDTLPLEDIFQQDDYDNMVPCKRLCHRLRKPEGTPFFST